MPPEVLRPDSDFVFFQDVFDLCGVQYTVLDCERSYKLLVGDKSHVLVFGKHGYFKEGRLYISDTETRRL